MKFKTKFENLDFVMHEDDEDNKRLLVACKDRLCVTDDERWVVASLTMDETKQLYEYLGQCIKD